MVTAAITMVGIVDAAIITAGGGAIIMDGGTITDAANSRFDHMKRRPPAMGILFA